MKITIIGTGLIGTSLGMALRSKHGEDVDIVGYDSDKDSHDAARKMGAVDRSEWNLDTAVRDADLVIVSTPPAAVYDVFDAISPYLKDGATVTDTAITKRAVIDWAEHLLPQSVGFVGGNPLIGAARPGQQNASGYLFHNARYAIVTPRGAPQDSVQTVVDMVESIDAKPLFMDPDEHDSYSAAVGGLPAVMAAAIINAASKSPSWAEISQFVGKDFTNMTEPAVNDPASVHGMAATNPDMVEHWIDQVIGELETIKQAVHNEDSRYEPDGALADSFVNAWENRLRLEVGIEPGPPDDRDPLPSSGETMMSLFLGRAAARFFKRRDNDDKTRYDRRKLG